MRGLVALLLLGLAAAMSAAAPRLAGLPAGPGHEETVEVRRVAWPLYIKESRKARDSGVCRRLTPADIIIEEDGEPVPVTALERRPLPVVHALLVDISVSMLRDDGLEHAKAAAIRYVNRLPAEDRVLVATFDDSMVMVSPPTNDRAQLTEAISGMRPGNYTALWDAVYDLIRYLEALPAQKVVVLLTDGEDSSSMITLTSVPIFDLVAGKSDLAIFPIGINLDAKPRLDRQQLGSVMRQLAETTGGLYFETRNGSQLNRIFDRIGDHLSRRFYAVYEPKPFGEGPMDQPELRDYRIRDVRMRVKKGVPCTLVPAGPTQRIEGRPDSSLLRAATTRTPDADARPSLGAIAPCLDLPESWRVTSELRLPLPRGWPEVAGESSLFVLDTPEILSLRAPDILVDRGVLYHRRALERDGKFRLALNRRPSIETRDIAVSIPALDLVRNSMYRPEDVLMHLVRRSLCDGAGETRSDSRPPFLVHGKTFLELREFIGLALFRYYPEYREWAQGKLREEAAPSIERMLAELNRKRYVAPDEMEKVRAALLAQAANPPTDAPQRFLAEWLGDVPARDLVIAMETRLANALVATDAEPADRSLALSIAETGWDAVHGWFPQATDVRILSVLVPAYSPERDVIGFYRVVLPRPNLFGPPIDPLPAAPLGLRTVRRLLEINDRIADLLHGGIEIESITHAVPFRRGRREPERRLREAGLLEPHHAEVEVAVVELSLADPRVPGSRFSLRTYFVGDVESPTGFGGCPVAEPSPRLVALDQALSSLDGWVRHPCPSRHVARAD